MVAALIRSGEVGASQLLEGAHAAAGGVEQTHERDSVHVGVAHGPDGLATDHAVGGAAADGEVVALHGDVTSVDPGHTDDTVGRRERLELIAFPLGSAGEDAGFAETAGIGGPPIWRASSARRSSSSSSACQLIAGSLV